MNGEQLRERDSEHIAQVLLVQLEIRLPGFRSVLIVPADDRIQAIGLSIALTQVMNRVGSVARLLAIDTSLRERSDSELVEASTLPDQRVTLEKWSLESGGTTESARARLNGFAGRTVVCSSSLTSQPLALLAASEVDGVIVAVRVGRTHRAEVQRARKVLDDVGATIIGAVTVP